MRFTKMHGLGNDYVYIDAASERVDDPASLARLVSNRHAGIGSDGLILIAPSELADVRMVMFNADGSRGQMCGNGIRCVGRYALERGLVREPEMRIETDAGVREVRCNLRDGRVESVRVDMGSPSFDPRSLPVSAAAPRGDELVEVPLELSGGERVVVTCVSMGNPHAVCFVDDLPSVDLERLGPLIERHAWFPERINAHFVAAESRSHLRVRTWERGSGATRACGTGACAVLVAAAKTGRGDRAATVTLPGGDLLVEWTDGGAVLMTGPAEHVCDGEFDPESLARSAGQADK